MMETKSRLGAYMTVEATLIVPIVMYVCIFVIYAGFFQYDRCLMRQDAYRAALRGSSIYRANNQEVYNETFAVAENMVADKYIATKSSYEIAVQGSVSVVMKGCVNMPFRGLATLVGNSEWQIEETMSSKCINPVFFIRSCRQLLPEKENEEKE